MPLILLILTIIQGQILMLPIVFALPPGEFQVRVVQVRHVNDGRDGHHGVRVAGRRVVVACLDIAGKG